MDDETMSFNDNPPYPVQAQEWLKELRSPAGLCQNSAEQFVKYKALRQAIEVTLSSTP